MNEIALMTAAPSHVWVPVSCAPMMPHLVRVMLVGFQCVIVIWASVCGNNVQMPKPFTKVKKKLCIFRKHIAHVVASESCIGTRFFKREPLLWYSLITFDQVCVFCLVEKCRTSFHFTIVCAYANVAGASAHRVILIQGKCDAITCHYYFKTMF